jgi:hypothetical protein
MSTGLQIITSVSSSPLNDQEGGVSNPALNFVRWTQNDLMDYMNKGLLEINNYRPDAFLETADLNIITGRYRQVLDPRYRLLKSIDAMSLTSDYSPGEPITQCDLQLMRAFSKKPCLPSGGHTSFRILSYAYDVKDPKNFYVTPMVPIGFPTTIKVTGTMVLAPVAYIDPNVTVVIDSVYLTALGFFIAAKAFEVDTESATSQAESTAFYKKFYNSLGVKFSQETKYNSGTFAGQGGSNQMTKARVP